MNIFKKSLALFLCVLMCAATFTSLITVRAEETGITYNAFSNAVVIEAAEIELSGDYADKIVKTASDNGAASVIIYADSTISFKASTAAVKKLADADIAVRLMTSDATLYILEKTVDEISTKVTSLAEITVDATDGFKATLVSDGKALTLDKPAIAVCTSDVPGINNVVGNAGSIGRSYIAGNTYYVYVNGDISANAVSTEVPVFADVKATDWFKANVDYVATKGYFNGTKPDKFSPFNQMTRGMVATVLSRIDEAPDKDITYTYTDVAKNAWFAKGVNWAFENNIVRPADTFRPDDSILRLELMEMLYSYALKLGLVEDITVEEGGLSHFIDEDKVTDEFSRKAVYFCTENGIVGGYSVGPGSFRLRPDGKATRAEVAAMIQRFMDYSVLGCMEVNEMNGEYSKFINARGSLVNLYNKINSGEEIVVSYFGGSITAGFGATGPNSWRDLTFNWLKESFPKGNFKHNAVAMGGSGSHLGAYRVGPDIIDMGSDLVFIEFSVNDNYSGTTAENRVSFYFEKIVREIREKLPEAEIIALYVTDSGLMQKTGVTNMHDSAKAQEKVCELYNVTSIDLGRCLAQEMGGGYNGELWSTYVKDSCHPLNPGYRVYADAIIEYMGRYLLGDKALTYGESKPHTLPATYADELTENSKFTYVPVNSLDIFDSIEGYTLVENGVFFDCTKTRGYMYPSADGNYFTYTFEGTDFGMYLEYGGGGYFIEYSVDGGEPVRKSITNTNHPFKLVSGLESGKHTITYKYLGENASNGVSPARKIGCLMIGDIKK